MDTTKDYVQPQINATDIGKKLPFNLPTQQTTTAGAGIVDTSLGGVASYLQGVTNQYNQLQSQQTQTGQNQLDLTKMLQGQTADLQTAQDQAGVTAEQQRLLQSQNQLSSANQRLLALQRQSQIAPEITQQESLGRGRTAAGIAPLDMAKQREIAIQAIPIAIEADIANYEATRSERSLAMAKEKAQQMVDLKYEPIKQKLELEKMAYEMNKENLDRIDKKRSEALQLAIKADEREYERKIEEEKGIQNVGMTLRKYGVADSVVKDVLENSNSLNDALIRAGSNLQDPAAKMELESIRLDQVLKKAHIQRQYRETQLLGEPSAKERKEQEQALKEAKSSIPVMQDKIDTINILKDHSGLSSRVGTGILTRTPVSTLGAIGKASTGVGLATLPVDVASKLSGSGQDFAGGVHKLVGGLTLQSLIDAKARGATFGALSEGELNILANSASAINDWELKDDKGKGLGVWNIDEKSFKKELDTIQNLTRRALLLSEGTQFTQDEQSVLDDMYGQSTQVDASAYFK